jgi:hypothetical protein
MYSTLKNGGAMKTTLLFLSLFIIYPAQSQTAEDFINAFNQFVREVIIETNGIEIKPESESGNTRWMETTRNFNLFKGVINKLIISNPHYKQLTPWELKDQPGGEALYTAVFAVREKVAVFIFYGDGIVSIAPDFDILR